MSLGGADDSSLVFAKPSFHSPQLHSFCHLLLNLHYSVPFLLSHRPWPLGRGVPGAVRGEVMAGRFGRKRTGQRMVFYAS